MDARDARRWVRVEVVLLELIRDLRAEREALLQSISEDVADLERKLEALDVVLQLIRSRPASSSGDVPLA